jgi:hypothetical protein
MKLLDMIEATGHLTEPYTFRVYTKRVWWYSVSMYDILYQDTVLCTGHGGHSVAEGLVYWMNRAFTAGKHETLLSISYVAVEGRYS